MTATRQRILRATTGSLSWQPQGADGEPADPGGTVTVGVTASDGTVVLAAGSPTSGTTDSPRTVALTVAQTAKLDILTTTWKIGTDTVAVTHHDIVGGYYFTSAELRDTEPALANITQYPLAAIARVRTELEAMVESVCSVAFVPRFGVATVTGAHTLVLPWSRLRAVRWMKSVGAGLASTDITISTPIPVSTAGLVDMGSLSYDCSREVQVGCEHGYDAPPFDLKRALMLAARVALNASKTAVPDRATSMQLADGGSVTLATPGVGGWHTGIPTVDEVINRYSASGPAIG